MLSIGSFVRYNRNGNETRSGFVLKHFPDKSQTLLVDDKSRKRRTVSVRKIWPFKQTKVVFLLCFVKFEYQDISVLKDLRHILFLTIGYRGANKNTQWLL